MTDRRNRKAITVAEQVLGWGAELITDAVEHAKREIDAADGYPTKVPGASAPTAEGRTTPPCACMGVGCDNCAPSAYTATERAMERRYDLQADREELRDALDAWVAQWHWITQQARKILGQRLERIHGQRCAGTVDATCTNNASTHRHPLTGSEITDLCDDCWLRACPICCRREADTRRQVEIDGRKVPGCEACRRKQLRGVAA